METEIIQQNVCTCSTELKKGLYAQKLICFFSDCMNYSNKIYCLSYNLALQIYKLSHKLYHHFNSLHRGSEATPREWKFTKEISVRELEKRCGKNFAEMEEHMLSPRSHSCCLAYSLSVAQDRKGVRQSAT